QDEPPESETRIKPVLRKGEEQGGTMLLAAANDAGEGDTGDDAGNDPQEAQEKRFPPNTSKVDKFFDDYTELAEKLAKELDTDPKYILSLMSLEGGWGDEGSREKNNPFGFVKNDEKMRFEKLEDAFDHFKRTRGPSVQGVKSMEEFVAKLQTPTHGLGKYNSEPPDARTKKRYDEKLFEQYETIIRRQDNWRSRRAS
ncbi:MAG: glucosaminidase domain-containing protein, partial [Proteobacteria bacterium]|nr:glucosaminidase domain-containing protein [Pseudomonadota bacterium]